MTRSCRAAALALTALTAWAGASCFAVRPCPGPVAPAVAAWPPPAPAEPVVWQVPRGAVPLPLEATPMPAPPAARETPPPVVPEAPAPPPGLEVSRSGGLREPAWTPAPQLRRAPPGVSPFLADVESHLPPEMGRQYYDRDPVTWCHETTHGVNSALRNRHHRPAFYPGGGKCALVEPPALTLGEVAAAVPVQFRGSRYSTYLVKQRGQWEREPLYVWDEWVAYNNGTSAGIEYRGRAGGQQSDDAVACLELSGYSLAVAAAARRKGVPVSEQFRAFLAWELRRSTSLYARALSVPAFGWPDRRLEGLWRGGDPWVVDELRALYGDALTVADLFPSALARGAAPAEVGGRPRAR